MLKRSVLVAVAFLAATRCLVVEYNSSLQKNLRGLFPVPKDSVIRNQGKVLVVGGSPDHPAEPYFSAIAAFKVGAERVKVLTTKENAIAINTYSPDIPARGVLNRFGFEDKTTHYIKNTDVIVWGPGVDNDNATLSSLKDIIKIARAFRKPVIVDHGGLHIVTSNPELIRDYPFPGVILLADSIEYEKLKQVFGVDKATKEIEFSKLGRFVTILKKGVIDSFVSANRTLSWKIAGGRGPKDLEGVGRLLSGTLAALYNWALQRYSANEELYPAFVATYGAARFARDYSKRAFEDKSWSVVTSDLVDYIGKSIRAHLLF